MRDTYHFTLLGHPQITHRGELLTGFISTKAQALLYYLAATGEAHSRDALATLFWGEMPTATARRNLTKALSNLRKLMGDALIADRQHVALALESAIYVDLAEMYELLPFQVEDEAALAGVSQIVDLYQGEFLQAFFVKDAPEFETWASGVRAQLQADFLQALAAAAEYAVQIGNMDAALALTERELSVDPLRESAHRRKMLLLNRQGQSDAALSHYAQTRDLLAQELEIPPEPETEALYKQLQAVNNPPPHNLPTDVTLFVGRESELRTLTELLSAPDCRLLTITGPGGIGKTRLSLQVAAHFIRPASLTLPQQNFADGVYFISLTSSDTAENVVAALTDILGFTFYDEGNARQQLLDALQNRQVLLVLDNVEHLVAASEARAGMAHPPAPTSLTELVSDMLAISPHVEVLMTSRARLNIQGEHVFQLTGLSYPPAKVEDPQRYSILINTTPLDPSDTDSVGQYSAVQLFLQSARRLQPNFSLAGENLASVIRICQLVQGMPLGILLATAWVDVLTPAEIAEEISRSLDFLEADLQDLPPRQRSIRAAIDHSWRMLAQDEQELFQKLSVFRGSFARRAAQQITDASLRTLQALVKKSLLQPVDQGRFMLHELLRQYAAEKLAQQPSVEEQIRQRHSHYFAAAVESWTVALKGARQQQALLEMEDDSENLRAAWQWLIAQGDCDRQWQMVDGLCQFYEWRGRYTEGATALDGALQRFQLMSNTGADADILQLQIALLSWQGIFHRHLGNAALAKAAMESALAKLALPALADEDIAAAQAFALLHLGESLRESDRVEAQMRYEQSLDLYRAAGDAWGTANALAALGWLIQHLGRYGEARLLYQESLEIRHALHDQRGIASALRALGGVTLYQGRHIEAEVLIQRSVTICREMDDQAAIAGSLSRLGEVLALLGRFDEAIEPLLESAQIYHRLGLYDGEMFSYAVLGHTQIHAGDPIDAWGHAMRAHQHFQAVDSQRGIAYATLILGWAELARENFSQAQAHLQQSAAIYIEIGQLDELGQAQALLGHCAYSRNDLSHAREYCMGALQTAHAIQAFMPMALALALHIRLLEADGKQNDAGVLRQPLATHPVVASSAWFTAVLGRTNGPETNTAPSDLAPLVDQLLRSNTDS